MPGFGLLADRFDGGALDAAVWSQSYGDPAVAGGRLRVPCTTGYAGARTASSYSLAWSQLSARVFPPTPGGAGTAACSLLVLSGTGGTDAGFLVDPAQNAMGLYLRVGYADDGAVFPAYDPVAHAWLRLREDAGSLHWETSPNGRVWTIRRTAASPAWASQSDLSLLFEAHRDAGAEDFAELDSLNITRPGRCGPAVRSAAELNPLARSAPSLNGG